MKFGLSVKNFGIYSNFDDLIALAIDAEEAGWDGIFMWDHILHIGRARRKTIDPWIALTAIATRTKEIILGPMVTPLARRRPWKVAREAISLDYLSKGRLILGVGLGWPKYDDFERYGEEGNTKIRAEKLDESLEILKGLWSGEPFGYEGKHFKIAEDTVFLPTPYNKKSTVPIWVGGGSWPNKKKPFRRAAKFNGSIPGYNNKDGEKVAQWSSKLAEYIQQYRKNLDGFDLVIGGILPVNQEKVSAYFKPIIEEGHITWWIEHVYSWKGEIDNIRKKIRKGPPSI